jgi:hypothetical protein
MGHYENQFLHLLYEEFKTWVLMPWLVLFKYIQYTGKHHCSIKEMTSFSVLCSDKWFGSIAHTAQPNFALGPMVQNQILRYGS